DAAGGPIRRPLAALPRLRRSDPLAGADRVGARPGRPPPPGAAAGDADDRQRPRLLPRHPSGDAGGARGRLHHGRAGEGAAGAGRAARPRPAQRAAPSRDRPRPEPGPRRGRCDRGRDRLLVPRRGTADLRGLPQARLPRPPGGLPAAHRDGGGGERRVRSALPLARSAPPGAAVVRRDSPAVTWRRLARHPLGRLGSALLAALAVLALGAPWLAPYD